MTRGRVYREAALENEIQHSSQLGSTRQHVAVKTVEKHKHTRDCHKISNSPRNDMVYQDAVESKWHGMGPALCISSLLPTTKTPANYIPRLFRHVAMAQSQSNLPFLNTSPETHSARSSLARIVERVCIWERFVNIYLRFRASKDC